jgi:hypothetical protein
MRRELVLLVAAAAGLAAAAGQAVDLVPRVRANEVVTVFAGAFGAGAALVAAIFEFRQSRDRSRRP